MRDFLSVNDFSKEELLEILELASELDTCENEKLLDEKIVSTLFFEPSTRTRLSFESAAYRLGAKILGFGSPDSTSLKKGESLRDTIKMIEGYSDVMVMRHFIEGAARFASEISSIPVINAGDGANEHPSQTLLDLYTIKKRFGDIAGKKIAFVGDLKYGRTVHSLSKALANFKCKLYFIAPDIIQIPDNIKEFLKRESIDFSLHSDYSEILEDIDVLYMTRIQRERFEDSAEYEKVKRIYQINQKEIVGKVKENMIILHPLPRVDEIDIDLDETKHALYFEQAKNGIPVRKAIYLLALGVKQFKNEKISKYLVSENNKIFCKNTRCVTHFEKTKNKFYEIDGNKSCYYCGKEIE